MTKKKSNKKPNVIKLTKVFMFFFSRHIDNAASAVGSAARSAVRAPFHQTKYHEKPGVFAISQTDDSRRMPHQQNYVRRISHRKIEQVKTDQVVVHNNNYYIVDDLAVVEIMPEAGLPLL